MMFHRIEVQSLIFITLLQEYLMRLTSPGDWIYNKQTVTTLEPLEIAKMCIWEKILDHVPSDIPYIVKIVSIIYLSYKFVEIVQLSLK